MSGSQRKTVLAIIGCLVLAVVSIFYYSAMTRPVIIGHTTSSMTLATLPMIDKSSTLLVSPTTSTPLLQDINDNFIRSCAESTTAATLMAKYLRNDRLRISRFKGLQHDIVINRFGDSNHPTYMGVIENGVFNIIEDFH